MGIYKGFQSDEEVYSLIVKFAEFHNLPLVDEETVLQEKIILEPPKLEKQSQEDYFYSLLQKQHDLLSKQLLYLNKLMSTYESKKDV